MASLIRLSGFPYSLSANPKNFNAPDDGNGINLTAEFTSSPGVHGNDEPFRIAGLGVLIDGGFWYAPKNLSPAYDSGWNSGTTHSIGCFRSAASLEHDLPLPVGKLERWRRVDSQHYCAQRQHDLYRELESPVSAV